MTRQSTLSEFTARLRDLMSIPPSRSRGNQAPTKARSWDSQFEQLALELFGLQFKHNLAYRRLCEGRKATPESVRRWQDIPTAPTVAFKELELTSLPETERTRVFHSSGTTEQRPSRHYHSTESLSLYEASVLPWFEAHLIAPGKTSFKFVMLTPPPDEVPHSSLVHMLETVRRTFAPNDAVYTGWVERGSGWGLDVAGTVEVLSGAIDAACPVLVLGTAFSFVHLLDHLAGAELQLRLPPGSRVLETGGYKGRSRTMPKAELHELIIRLLGVPSANIVCEYGMSELGSQAYDHAVGEQTQPRRFHFPPWARAVIVSPETGREATEGETGLIRVFDLANVYSVIAIQTEDLGVRRGDGFELLGRAAMAEPRGCSLMASSPPA